MSEIKLQVSPDEINKYVAEQVLKSALGKTLEDETNKIISKLKDPFTGFLRGLIEEHLLCILRNMLAQGEINERLKDLVKNELTDEIVLELFTITLDSIKGRLRR